MESLPFTSEGYNRATAIMKEKYGNKSEIVKAYVKEILSLPRIPSANGRAIAEFSDKLTYCVQSLQSLGKLDEVRDLTAVTLDKLSAIRGDLVRSDGDCGFVEIRLVLVVRMSKPRGVEIERECS